MVSPKMMVYSGCLGIASIFTIFLIHHFVHFSITNRTSIAGLTMVILGHFGTKHSMGKKNNYYDRFSALFAVGTVIFIVGMGLIKVR